MVAYCCVRGCSNNSSNKKKDPNDITSFHAFPSNIELKEKWLRAIGRPTWAPPSYARVCSAHFSYEQINHDGRRIRIKDDAVPVKDLPVNSNFEASDVEVCRFCLAANLKMYSLQGGVHKVYLESVVGNNDNYNIEGLPQFVCYQCAAHLKKCYDLLEKSMIAQATLLDIFAHNGKITKKLIDSKSRKELNLRSTLTVHEIKTNYEFKYNDGSEFLNIDVENIDSTCLEKYFSSPKIEVATIEAKAEDVDDITFDTIDIHFNESIDKVDVKFDTAEAFYEELGNCEADLSSDDEIKSETAEIELKERTKGNRRTKKRLKSNNYEGFTPDEVKMQKYFRIERLTLEQQMEEWNRSKGNKACSGESFKCQTCSKMFAHHNSYRLHTLSHNPTRGKSECPVCKLRFKNEVLANSHVNRTHAKKFYCKICPKSFNNVGVAKKHHKWHSGYMYKCAECPFVSAHASALGAHARSQHAGAHACALCGHAFVSARGLTLHTATVHQDLPEQEDGQKYRCHQCGLNFKSEGARRVHMLTSKQHKKKNSLCDPAPQDPRLKNTCSKCGVELSSLKELIEHGKAEHKRAKHWSVPDDSYPTQCELCSITVQSRKEHWWHVRREHRGARGSYRPVVTAVCDTCGKGYQNSTKLHLHELRHAPPSVPCTQCPRMFYDKYALARHVAVHGAARPHTCRACGQGFKQRGNLERHSRVHTGATPYECSMCGKKFKYSTSMNVHIRTVHYKLPPAPRKKRNKAKADESTSYGKE